LALELTKLPLATALRGSLREGYGLKHFSADAQAGTVTALIALPLGMALAIASGVPPQYGLATVIVGGAVAALAGGSRVQVSGPTAAFVALLLPVVLRHGLGGLLTAGLMAGLILLAMGGLGLGRAVEYVPLPVITGFTSGVALVIASLQLKDLFGLQIAAPTEHFIERLSVVSQALPTLSAAEASMGFGTLALIIYLGRKARRLPAPVVALVAAAVVAALLQRWRPEWGVATIGSRFQYLDAGQLIPGIPRGLPGLRWPWDWAVEGGQAFEPSLASLRQLLPSSLAIALLGAVESLLSASVADGMSGRRHDPDAELVGQGLANLAVPFFGGIPATGAIARTATAIRFGAVSPFAALTHSGVVLLVVLALAPLAAWLPMAALAALLLVVAWNMAEAHRFRMILKVGRAGDRLVLLTCFGLTVVFDMTVGVLAGILLAALILIRRLDEMGGTRVLKAGSEGLAPGLRVPDGSLIFEVSGILLFGSAARTLDPLLRYGQDVHHVVLDLSQVRSMDISGLQALESVVQDLRKAGKTVALAAAHERVLLLLSRSHYFGDPQLGPPVFGDLQSALDQAQG
jgi:SulP family sulfate permease